MEEATSLAAPSARRPRGRPRTHSRESLIETAAVVLRERGYHGTRYHDVAVAAGIAMSSLQYHFHSIDELRREALVNLMRQRRESMATSVDRSLSPWDRIDALLRSIWEDQGDDKYPAWFLWLEQRQADGDHETVKRLRDEATHVFLVEACVAMREGMEAGEFTLEESINDTIREIGAVIYGLLYEMVEFGPEQRATTLRLARKGVWRILHSSAGDPPA
ncbi:MAG: TetR family transcriptional regulator [Nocardioides sp.]